MGRAAREWAESNLAWPAAIDAYLDVYERVIHARGATTTPRWIGGPS
jgi:hypothetical protein